MRFSGVLRAGVLVAMGGTVLAAEARAADMPLYEAPEITYSEPEQIEFGTGWYLRGDGAYTDEDRPAFNVTAHSFDRNATTSGYAFGIGAGAQLTSFFRADVTADFLDPFDYSGHVSCGSGCDTLAKDHVWRWDALANGYFDLGTWYGITPYVGAGVGVAATRQDTEVLVTSVRARPLETTGTIGDYQFAWAAMAGFSYKFAPHALIDIGYRYLDLGTTKIALTPIATTHKDLTSQQVRIGVRYTID